MAFLLQPQQLANLTLEASPSIINQTHWDGFKFIVNPKQAIPGFSFETLASDLLREPTGFSNTSNAPCYFDMDGFVDVPPQWNSHGWQLMIHKKFDIISVNNFVYSWPNQLWHVRVTLN